jgi:hypothetical protein
MNLFVDMNKNFPRRGILLKELSLWESSHEVTHLNPKNITTIVRELSLMIWQITSVLSSYDPPLLIGPLL